MSKQIEFERAVEAYRHGSLQSAAQICRALLQSTPDDAAALHLLGKIADREGDLDSAIAHVRAALAAEPGLQEARYTLGDLYVSAGDLAAAEAAFQLAIDSQPESAAPWIRQGDAMRRAGLPDEAISAYREAIDRDADSAEAWARLGMVFLERGSVGDAMMALKRAVKKRPDDVEARTALAMALRRLGRAREAIAALQDSISLQPDAASTHQQLAVLLLEQERLAEAEAAFGCALELDPMLVSAHYGLGLALERAGELERAAARYARVLEFQPDSVDARLALLLVCQRLCDWDAVDHLARDMTESSGDVPVPPLAAVALGLPAQAQLEYASHFAKSIQVAQAKPPAAVFKSRPITVAYLSGDFRDNALGRAIAAILENHDRSRIRLAAFSYGPDDKGGVRRRVKSAVDEFVDIRYHSHEAAVREIRTRGVQILVDLGGYGRDARPQIVAPRAAPVQVGMLGYRGTLGGAFNDYIVVDDYLVPPGAERYYSEQPLRMPHGLLVAERSVVEAASGDAGGPPEDAFVFCCFDDTSKISRALFVVWMQLLRGVPESVLWLETSSPQPAGRLQAAAQAAGVDPARLLFVPPADGPTRISRYARADLALDTFPCNGGATIAEALSGGCPVLTCSGDSYVSRTGGSLLTSFGVDELICGDLDHYAQVALELAAAPDRLARIRERLHDATQDAAMLDGRAFSAALETAFEEMLRRGARGEQPAALRPVPG